MQFRPKRIRFPRLGWNFHTLVPATLLLLSLPFLFTGREHGPIALVYSWLGLSREGFASHGYVWQLVTYPLLHGSFTHWAGNALFLYYYGGRIHDIFGEREVWRTAAWSALAGGVLHLLIPESNTLVGASGAAMGLFVALTVVSPESKMLPLPLRARNLRNGLILATLVMLLMIPGLGVPVFGELGQLVSENGGGALFQIGHACHLGGALAGYWVMGKYLRKPITLAQLQKQRAAREDTDAA